MADFTRPKERQGWARHFHAGGSSIQELVALVKKAGFSAVEVQELQPVPFSAFPGAGFVLAYQTKPQ